MKKQKKLQSDRHVDKTTALKWVIIGLGIAIAISWIIWFTCDCIFVSKGITINTDVFQVKSIITEEVLFEIPYIKDWYWSQHWYQICNKLGTVTLSLLGGYVVLQLAYMVICGLNVKKDIKYYIYQLIVTAASFITITVCIIEAAQMMVNEKYVLDITFLPPAFNVFHLDYLKWMSISFACSVFTNVLMLCSFKKFDKHSLIKDCNILVLVLGAASVALFVPFMLSLGWNDPFIGGADSFEKWIILAQDSITWKHIVCQCITMPMGVLAGMVMVLLVIRLITVMFVYNQKWSEKKSHIIIFSAITFLMFASFIIAHANKLDFEKLVNDYNSMKLGCLLVVLAQTVSCALASTYCLISRANYAKRAA